MTAALTAEKLVKSYGAFRALDGLDLEAEQGTVFGLLGPNGAGKTTAVRVLTTLSRPDSGRAVVGGHDVVRDPHRVRGLIGLSGQHAAVDDLLTGRENLQLVGELCHLGRAAAAGRAQVLVARFELDDVADKQTMTYSGGIRRRFDLAAALVTRPAVLFLDEPTTGLDPRSRLMLWELISGLVVDGTTVLLTTQYLEEADRLADRIAVVDTGKVIAEGTSDELKAMVGGERIDVVVRDPKSVGTASDALSTVAVGTAEVDERAQRVTVPVLGGAGVLSKAIRELDARDVLVADIGLRRPTLDDVFLSLTGHRTGTGPQPTTAKGK